jgi:hypothetical protein
VNGHGRRERSRSRERRRDSKGIFPRNTTNRTAETDKPQNVEEIALTATLALDHVRLSAMVARQYANARHYDEMTTTGIEHETEHPRKKRTMTRGP